mgnify:CR=1 FL=1
MHKLYLDANILYDIVDNKRPFHKEAELIFSLAENNKLQIFTSIINPVFLNYSLMKIIRNRQKVLTMICEISKLLSLVEINQQIYYSALNNGYSDFEDDIQYYSALSVKDISAIITNNKKDFIKSLIPLLTPGEFLKKFPL